RHRNRGRGPPAACGGGTGPGGACRRDADRAGSAARGGNPRRSAGAGSGRDLRGRGPGRPRPETVNGGARMSKGFDLGGLVQQAKQLQERLTSVQEEIAARTAEGRAGGGMVTAVVNGRMELLSVEIDPSLLEKTPDRTMLQDLVVAAVNEALRAARALVADEM